MNAFCRSDGRISMLEKKRSFIMTACVAATLAFLPACKKQRQEVQAMPKQQVTVISAEKQRYTERFDFPGRIEAVDSVTLKTRVSGFLKERLFEEGDVVKKGQLLFTIEKEPFEAKVVQASADLAKAEADAKNAKLNLNRALELRKTGNISQAGVDAREAENAVAAANVLQAKAQLNLAKIDLSYTDIRAPFTGKIGLAGFTDGEFLAANSTLATIVSRDPMYVVFSVSEQELLSMQNAGVFQKNSENLSVSMQMADGSFYPSAGKINFFDVVVNEGTDTIKLRADFPNPDNRLIAGQYVTVALAYEAPEEKIVVPQKAVMSSTATKFVYVVDAQNKVMNIPVVLGPVQGENVVVLSGLSVADRVMTEGLQKVRPGQEVVVQTSAANKNLSVSKKNDAEKSADAGKSAGTPSAAAAKK